MKILYIGCPMRGQFVLTIASIDIIARCPTQCSTLKVLLLCPCTNTAMANRIHTVPGLRTVHTSCVVLSGSGALGGGELSITGITSTALPATLETFSCSCLVGCKWERPVSWSRANSQAVCSIRLSPLCVPGHPPSPGTAFNHPYSPVGLFCRGNSGRPQDI